jgi:hypothetical protein
MLYKKEALVLCPLNFELYSTKKRDDDEEEEECHFSKFHVVVVAGRWYSQPSWDSDRLKIWKLKVRGRSSNPFSIFFTKTHHCITDHCAASIY